MSLPIKVVLFLSLSFYEATAQVAAPATVTSIIESNSTIPATSLPGGTSAKYRAPESIINDFNNFAGQIEELSGRYNEMERHVQNAFCHADLPVKKGSFEPTNSFAVSKLASDLEDLAATVRKLEQNLTSASNLSQIQSSDLDNWKKGIDQKIANHLAQVQQSLDSLNNSIARKASMESVSQIKNDSFRYHEVVTLTDVVMGGCTPKFHRTILANSAMDCLRKCEDMGPESCRFSIYHPVDGCNRYPSANGCFYDQIRDSGYMVIFRTTATFDTVSSGSLVNGDDIRRNSTPIAQNLPRPQCRLACALTPECKSCSFEVASQKCYLKTRDLSMVSDLDPMFVKGGVTWRVFKKPKD